MQNNEPAAGMAADTASTTMTIPELVNENGPRCGYRDWTQAHGRAWAEFDADPVEGRLQVAVLDGWQLRVEDAQAFDGTVDGVIAFVDKPAQGGEPQLVHPLSDRLFETTSDAFEALFDAGVLAVRVYEDECWSVQVWKRTGRGYGLTNRVLLLEYRTPPSTTKRVAAERAYQATLPGATGAYAERYRAMAHHPQMEPGDLVDVSGALFERTGDGWRYVTSSNAYGGHAPSVVPVPERAIDGHAVSDGHRIDLTTGVRIGWGLNGWEVRYDGVDGRPLDVVANDTDGEVTRPDNAACAEQWRELDETCDPTAHRDAVDAVTLDNVAPSGAQLIPLLGHAVLFNGYARLDGVNADVKRLYDLATHTADHELGALVLRVLFGLQLKNPSATVSTPTPDGGHVVRVTGDEHALISGLLAPGGVNKTGILSSAFKSLRADRFPGQAFHRWVTDNPDSYDADDVVTDMEG